MPPWVEIGRVRSVAPGKRSLRIVLDAPYGAALDGVRFLHLMVAGKPMRLPLLSVERARGEWNAVFGAGVSKDAVATLRGVTVVMEESELPPPPEGAYNLRDWVGLAVVDANDTPIGEVGSVYETAAHGAIEVIKPDGRVVMLPAIPQVVALVDLEAERIVLGDYTPYMVEHED